MSRYSIPAKEPLKYMVVVGYDKPLQTFFANVENRIQNTEEDEDLVLSLGDSMSEILTVEDLKSKLDKYAEVPNYLVNTLEKEYNDGLGYTNPMMNLLKSKGLFF